VPKAYQPTDAESNDGKFEKRFVSGHRFSDANNGLPMIAPGMMRMSRVLQAFP
jgi:hypothetical protein